MSSDAHKLKAAEAALTHVQSGMKLGLGTGSTAAKFVDLLGARVKGGLDVLCVATSEATAKQAQALGIRLTTLDDITELDLAVDGADEVSEDCDLIKGGGGALLREKIVADAAKKFIVIADESKLVTTLGKFPLPLEVVPWALKTTIARTKYMAEVECEGPITQRMGQDGKPFVTDNGNFIVDCKFGAIDDTDTLDMLLKSVPGVVENGMFLNMTDLVLIGGPGGVKEIEAPDYSHLFDFDGGEDLDPEVEAEAQRQLDEIFKPKKKR